ncbi:MAG: Rpn family recombination-promoting nuclease/putative transposase [Ruminococcaceae bacterium]|nr:Rpn family recombination-promoting nuclease/putative transposase [Oscillospiraceae bacterium]
MTLDQDQKKAFHQGILESIQKMCLMDDNFMSMVLQHKECMELVLRIILGKDDLSVIECKTQYEIHNLRNRTVRLDVFAVDSEGKYYDIEIQRTDAGASPKRARYNGSMMDANSLEKSEGVDNLPETYVIFITENDVLGENRPLYTIERVIKESGRPFNDGLHIIYVNSQIRDESALGKLMRDFHNPEPFTMNYDILSDQSNFYKNGKGAPKMCKILEDLYKEFSEEVRAEAEAKGKEENKKENAINLLKTKKLSVKEIADAIGLSIDEVNKLAESYPA